MDAELQLRLVASLLLAGAALTALAALLRMLRAAHAGQQLHRAIGRRGQPARRAAERLVLLQRAGRMLLGSGQAAEDTARLLRLAGFWQPNAAPVFAAGRLLLALLAGLGFWIAFRHDGNALSYAALAAVLCAILVSRLMKGYAERRAMRMRGELSSAIGLVVLGLEGGAGIEHALRFAADQSAAPTPTLSPALRALNRDLDGGMPHDGALARLAERAAVEEMRLATDLVRQSLRFGTELIVPLRALAVELGEQRLARGRERVGSATVKMTVVMIIAFLPALLILMGAPAFSGLLAGLSNLGHG